jgi:hypothetical protein
VAYGDTFTLDYEGQVVLVRIVGDPPVRVYDLGMESGILEILKQNQIEVVKVPPFCPHWRTTSLTA